MTAIRPMKAVAGPVPSGPDWVFEIKWDGMRAVVTNTAEGIAATSATGREIGAGFPELGALHDHLGDLDVVLDGELVAFAPTGTPDFATLQQRMHLTDAATIERRRREVPVTFVAFDLLRLDGTDTTALPWHQRRRLLESLVDPGPGWRLTTVHEADGTDLLAEVAERGLEGIVAKRRDSSYRAGTRSPDWVKTKARHEQEFLVGGWTSRGDHQPGTTGAGLGSVLVGHLDDGSLRLAGRVGSGIGADLERLLLDRLSAVELDHSPFAGPVPTVRGRRVRWCRPTVVVEVAFAEWTGDGQLRHPVLLGVRDDVDPTTVRRE